MLVSGVVTLSVLGPIGTWVGAGIAAFFKWLDASESGDPKKIVVKNSAVA